MMNLSELKSFDVDPADGLSYDDAHREAARAEQEQPCTCQRKARTRLGGVLYPSLIEKADADPDCELHFPWVREDDASRVDAMRVWLAGYQAGYATGSEAAAARGVPVFGDPDWDELDEERRLAAREAEAAPSLPGVGTRVRLARDAERFPHFVAPAGATGTVVEAPDPIVFAVRLDEAVAGAEEWSNEVHWLDGDAELNNLDVAEYVARDIEVLEGEPEERAALVARVTAEFEAEQAALGARRAAALERLSADAPAEGGDELELVVSAGHAEYLGSGDGVTVEEIWSPLGDDHDSYADETDAREVFEERRPGVEAPADCDLSWETVLRLRGTLAAVHGWYLSLAGDVSGGPEGGDDDTFDYWPSGVRLAAQVAAELDERDGGDRGRGLEAEVLRSLREREMDAEELNLPASWDFARSVEVEIPFGLTRAELRLDPSSVDDARTLSASLRLLADEAERAEEAWASGGGNSEAAEGYVTAAREAERILRAAVLLRVERAGTLAECLDTAIVWERG